MEHNDHSPPPGSFAKLMAAQQKKGHSGQPNPEKAPTRQTEKPDQTKTERMHASMHTNKHASMQPYMRAVLDEKATYSFAFRYPPDLLEKLEDVLHHVRKRHKVKLTKNSVAVTAMAFLLWDFETNAKKSILYRLLVKRRER
jgi:hypothetical protein